MNKKKVILFVLSIALTSMFLVLDVTASTVSETAPDTQSDVTLTLSGIDSPENMADTVKILLLLTIIALVPSILVLMTGFTRIVIVLSFVRNALSLQQTPPNQVITGLALFLTVFLMFPIFTEINDNALQPYIDNAITEEEAIDNVLVPLRNFMISQTYEEDLATFMDIAEAPPLEQADLDNGDYSGIKTEILIPAFVISELKRAFIIGFCIYIPFLIIDLVVSSTLMSLGMMMLPPAMVSMPFKLILFLIVDGWNLVIQTIMISFTNKGL